LDERFLFLFIAAINCGYMQGDGFMTPEEKEKLRPYAFVLMLILCAAFVYCVHVFLEEFSNPQCCADYSGLNGDVHECGNCSLILEKYRYLPQQQIIPNNLSNINISPLLPQKKR